MSRVIRKSHPWGVRILVAITAFIAVSALGSGRATAQTITEIIDSTGDGAGNGLSSSSAIAVDAAGNVYVTGGLLGNSNVFKITPTGVITEIIDETGDGAGIGLDSPKDIAVDAAGNVYVTGLFSNNAFKITPAGDITQIIDATGDGRINGFLLILPRGIAVDAAGNVYVAGSGSVFKITPDGVITRFAGPISAPPPHSRWRYRRGRSGQRLC